MEFEIKNLLITGGAGFIGSHFVKLSIKNGYNVTVIDKLTYSGSIETIAKFKYLENFEFIHGSILDDELLNFLEVTRVLSLPWGTHLQNCKTC